MKGIFLAQALKRDRLQPIHAHNIFKLSSTHFCIELSLTRKL